MRPGAHIVVAAAARFYAPLLVLFAALILSRGVAGAGVGFTAGLAFGLLLMMHALVFGVDAARAALAPWLARLLLALGATAAAITGGLHGLVYAAQILETGLFVATAAASAIVIQVLFGRAPTLRDDPS